jgi:two-component system sensor histidine kinase PhoQ
MLSLHARLLVAASIVLVAFLGLTGLTLDRAFRDSALTAVKDRLQTQVYMLLGVADLDPGNGLLLPDILPEVKFSTPGSGLYARVTDQEGNVVWRSRSTLGMVLPRLPEKGNFGQARFQEVGNADALPFFALALSISWEVTPDTYRGYTFEVVESQQDYTEQVSSFRRSLWGWLLGVALVLLMVQGVILRWGLDPLRKVAREVRAIESGQQRQLSGNYPEELHSLTTNLNVLIRNSQAHLERYRNALADLAHSLKTPLAVLRGIVESNLLPPDLRASLREQMERMNRTVDYQLQRAAVVGRIALKAPVSVESVAGKVMGALAKVYVQRSLQFHRQIDQQLLFYGEEGDLFEILGNLTDNACKWARSQVAIRAFPLTASAKQTGLVIEVEDDGPGIPEAQKQVILQRGKRADPNIAGHGIGLAVVRDIVEEVYRGTLEIAQGSQGGTCIRVRLQWS